MSLVGSTVGSIRIDSRLGEGGMGEVYLGFDLKLERHVAVKAMRPHGPLPRLGEQRKERFLREARLLSRLGNPGICQVYDLLETPDADFLVLEYVQGRTLREFGEEQPSFERRLRVAEQIATALAAAHEERIVHRDLKADNIMVTPGDGVKILDFGIARSVEDGEPDFEPGEDASHGSRATMPLPPTQVWGRAPAGPTRLQPGRRPAGVVTRRGLVFGTLPAMSPEQINGETVDETSDLYSLGVLLQELFTGSRAYGDSEGQELERRIARAETEPIGGLDADLIRLLRDLENLDPRRRPDAASVAERLRWIRAKPQRERRRRLRLFATGAVFVALIVVTAVVSRLAYVASAARREADSRRGQAEALIGFMLGDLRQKLTGLGRLELLDEVGDRALAYFERLPEDELSQSDLVNRTKTVLQIGDVRRSQGNLDAALLAYRKGEELALKARSRFPRAVAMGRQVIDARTLVGQVHYDRGEAPLTQAAWSAALSDAGNMLSETPGDPEALFALATSEHNMGTLRELQGDLEGAARFYRDSLRDQRAYAKARPPDQEVQSELANTLAFVSVVLERQGDLDGARAQRREHLAILEGLLAEHPQDSVLQQDVAAARGFLANVLGNFGAVDEARVLYAQGLESIEALAARDAKNLDLARWLVVFRMAVAELDAGRNEPARAVANFRLACPAAGALSAGDPTNPDFRLQAGICRCRFAGALASSSPAAAELEARRGQEILEPLRQGAPGEQLLALLAEADVLRGRVATASGDLAEARRSWERALGTLASCRRPLTYWRVLAPFAEASLRLDRAADAASAVAALDRAHYQRSEWIALRRAKGL